MNNELAEMGEVCVCVCEREREREIKREREKWCERKGEI